MTDLQPPELLSVQSPDPWMGASRLPELPVKILVVDSPSDGSNSSRSLVERLERLADELGAADGVAIAGRTVEPQVLSLGQLAQQRFDIVILRPSPVLPLALSGELPAEAMGLLGHELSACAARVCVLAPAQVSSAGDDCGWRRSLALKLVASGSPPVLVLPGDWAVDDIDRFVIEFVERLLHDSALESAVQRTLGELTPVPTLVLPAAGRHGLNLGRLLEAHRQRIDDETSFLRGRRREVEASQPPGPQPPEGRLQAWALRLEGIEERLERLERIRAACDEIDRDRDPAGWSRLAANIHELALLERLGEVRTESVPSAQREFSAEEPPR